MPGKLQAIISSVTAWNTFARPPLHDFSSMCSWAAWKSFFPWRTNPYDMPISMRLTTHTGFLKSLEINTPQVKIAGVGWLDLSKKDLEIDLKMTTTAGINLSKIPLLGYVLAGKKEDPTTTIQISGDFEDPHVQKTVVKDIISLPFEALYRTLKLPAHLVERIGEGKGDTN